MCSVCAPALNVSTHHCVSCANDAETNSRMASSRYSLTERWRTLAQ